MRTHRLVPSLAAIDLNLLVALDALLQEESVTLAGQRIGLSQPATSHALARLRDLLHDELLVREGRAMKRTELGRQLTPTVRRLLGEIEATLLSRRQFDPRTSRRTFRLTTNDYCGAVLLPGVLRRVRLEAPDVRVEAHPQQGLPQLSELARGELDVALGTHVHAPPPLRSRELLRDGFVCMVRRGAGAPRRMTLQRYVALEHLLVASPGYGPGVVDHALEALGMQRRVAARVPHFLVAPAIIEQTDLVLTLPKRIALAFARPTLSVLAPPIALAPFAAQLVWHERSQLDPGAVWLREIITGVAGAA